MGLGKGVLFTMAVDEEEGEIACGVCFATITYFLAQEEEDNFELIYDKYN